jgi:hypothetical protein
MDHIDEHYENLQTAESELRWFFEERGYEVEVERAIETKSRTIKYSITCGRYTFRSSVTLMKNYSAIESVWECFKKEDDFIIEKRIALNGVTYIDNNSCWVWKDSGTLEELVKYIYNDR